MPSADLTQVVIIIVGITTSTLSIIGIVIKAFLSAHKTSLEYFMRSIDKKDELIALQHQELRSIIEKGHQVTEKNSEALERFTEAINANTITEKSNAEAFTTLLMNVVPNNHGQ